jgi:hypothetical protein
MDSEKLIYIRSPKKAVLNGIVSILAVCAFLYVTISKGVNPLIPCGLVLAFVIFVMAPQRRYLSHLIKCGKCNAELVEEIYSFKHKKQTFKYCPQCGVELEHE